MSECSKIEWVVLDAMGVIYSIGRDVENLLIPFLRERGCEAPDDHIQRDYKACSLGHMNSDDFWMACGMEAYDGLDCEYTFQHNLSAGLLPTLAALRERGVHIACLSNDVSEWARLLRRRFRLDRWVEKWIISADVGLRKPNSLIYARLLGELESKAENCLIVDDNMRNIEAAAKLDFQTMHFNREADGGAVGQFNKLLGMAGLIEASCP